MAYSLSLPAQFDQQWKAKIQDKERTEEPHVTVIRRTRKWRYGLRSKDFLDRAPDPAEVPGELVEHIHLHWEELCKEWDRIYPENPVSSDED